MRTAKRLTAAYIASRVLDFEGSFDPCPISEGERYQTSERSSGTLTVPLDAANVSRSPFESAKAKPPSGSPLIDTSMRLAVESLRLICSRSLGRSYDMLPEQSMTRRWSVGVSTGFADAWAPLPMGWRTRYLEVETLKLLAVVMGVPLVVGFTGRGYLHR